MNKEKFIAVLSTQIQIPCDALVLLAGDGMNRIKHTADLYKEKMAPCIVLVSGDKRWEYGSAPSNDLAAGLEALCIPRNIMHIEETAMNTRDEAMRALALAADRGWNSLMFVTSPHHQYRAFLTALAAMRDLGLNIRISISVAPLSWTVENPWGRRIDMLNAEFERIEKYRALGHVASYEDALAYFENLEQKP